MKACMAKKTSNRWWAPATSHAMSQAWCNEHFERFASVVTHTKIPTGFRPSLAPRATLARVHTENT